VASLPSEKKYKRDSSHRPEGARNRTVSACDLRLEGLTGGFAGHEIPLRISWSAIIAPNSSEM
jgi:hypothetical protein